MALIASACMLYENMVFPDHDQYMVMESLPFRILLGDAEC